MKRMQLFSVLAILGVAAGFSTYYLIRHLSAPRSAVTALASWPVRYATVGELAKDAELIVAGTVDKNMGSTELGPGLVSTQFVFNVEEVVKGSLLQGANSIVVQQTGGTVDRQTIEVRDDPLFQIGDKYVLFLREFEPGKYVTIGGPQGRFVIRAGLVYSMPVLDSPPGADLSAISGKDLADFLNEIRNSSESH